MKLHASGAVAWTAFYDPMQFPRTGHPIPIVFNYTEAITAMNSNIMFTHVLCISMKTNTNKIVNTPAEAKVFYEEKGDL